MSAANNGLFFFRKQQKPRKSTAHVGVVGLRMTSAGYHSVQEESAPQICCGSARRAKVGRQPLLTRGAPDLIFTFGFHTQSFPEA